MQRSNPILLNKWPGCDRLHLSPIFYHKIIQIRCLVLEDSLPLSNFCPTFWCYICAHKLDSKWIEQKSFYSVTMWVLMTYICNIWVDKRQLMVGQEWVTKAIISAAIIEYRFALFLGLKGLLRAFDVNKVFSFSNFCTLCYQILGF